MMWLKLYNKKLGCMTKLYSFAKPYLKNMKLDIVNWRKLKCIYDQINHFDINYKEQYQSL